MSSEVVDTFQGLREFASFGGEDRRLALLRANGGTLRASKVAHGRRSGLELAATDTITIAGVLAVLATDAEVVQAARGALADEFVSHLPDGYDTGAGELGPRMSGGQRQRIAIARALLKDAPILVMDEAVSNLDAASEREVAAAMECARAGRTTLVIAHRLSTILAADRIVVLDDGRVAQIGTHDELIARGGAYAQLLASQLDGMQQP